MKRKFSEVYSSSSGSSSSSIDSNFRRSSQWNEAYTVKFLQLLDEVVSGETRFVGLRYKSTWEDFTTELNKQIKVDNPEFLGFDMLTVVNYGQKLRSFYNEFKDLPYTLTHFSLYEKCFKKCECKNCKRCANKIVFANALSSSEKTSSSRTNSSRKRKAKATTSGKNDIAERLAYFKETHFVSTKIIDNACKHFTGNSLSGAVWLLLTESRQIEHLKELFGGS